MALTLDEIKQKIQDIKTRLSSYSFQLGEQVTQSIIDGWELVTEDVEKVGYEAVKKQGEESMRAISDHEIVVKDRLNDYVTNTSIPAVLAQENASKQVLSDWASHITTSDDGVVTAEREARILADQNLDNKKLDKAGGTMSGQITSNIDVIIRRSSTSDALALYGSNSWSNGASFNLYGKDHTTKAGRFELTARSASDYIMLEGLGDGTLKWGGNKVLTTANGLPLSGGTLSGDVFASSYIHGGNGTSGYLTLYGGNSWQGGAYLALRGRTHATEPDEWFLSTSNGTKQLRGKPDGSLTWAGNEVLTTANGLPKTGGEVTGTISSKINPSLRVYHPNNLGDTPTSNAYISAVSINGKDDNVRLGCLEHGIYTDGTSSTNIAVRNNANDNYIVFRVCSDGFCRFGNGTVVVKTGEQKGVNWYRKYSDGWIEQGGTFTGNGASNTVTLNIAFSDTNYTIVTHPKSRPTNATGDNNYLSCIISTTATSFVFSYYDSDGTDKREGPVSWYACGY